MGVSDGCGETGGAGRAAGGGGRSGVGHAVSASARARCGVGCRPLRGCRAGGFRGLRTDRAVERWAPRRGSAWRSSGSACGREAVGGLAQLFMDGEQAEGHAEPTDDRIARRVARAGARAPRCPVDRRSVRRYGPVSRPRRLRDRVTGAHLYIRRAAPGRACHVCADFGGAQGTCLSGVRNIVTWSEWWRDNKRGCAGCQRYEQKRFRKVVEIAFYPRRHLRRDAGKSRRAPASCLVNALARPGRGMPGSTTALAVNTP